MKINPGFLKNKFFIISLLLIVFFGIQLLLELAPEKRIKRHILKGEELLEEGNFVLACEEAQKAIEIDNTNEEALLLLGEIYIAQKQYGLAIDKLSLAAEYNPNMAEIYYYKSIAYRGKEKFSLSLNSLQKASDLNRDYDKKLKEMIFMEKIKTHTEYGTYLYKRGYDEEGQKQYEKALKMDPSNGKLHYDIALIYMSLNRLDLAFEECKKIITLSPSLGLDAFYKLAKAWKKDITENEDSSGYRLFLQKLDEMASYEKNIIKKALLKELNTYISKELYNTKEERQEDEK